MGIIIEQLLKPKWRIICFVNQAIQIELFVKQVPKKLQQ